jgi:HlyD family secretion protein
MKRAAILTLIIIVVAGGIAAWLFWKHERAQRPTNELTLYGNLDLRQIDLAFNNNERIISVLVQEGDRVRRGQILAHLDTSRLAPQVDNAVAMLAAQRAVVDRLHHGSRPEEIAQAKANVDSALADARNARVSFERLTSLRSTSSGAVSQQDVDNAKAVLDVAEAKAQVNQKAFDLAVIGPRVEDIAQAEAQLRGTEAQLALLRQQLADAQLIAPLDAVVRSRLMEPGEMATPMKPVFTLAIIDPKWVRAYVGEPDLGEVRHGAPATVTVDSFPKRKFDGWVGFISPIAEFTPKPVQTEELRPKLVYEVRVFVNDPNDDLRLGMPATVHLLLRSPADTERQPKTLPAAATAPIAEANEP